MGVKEETWLSTLKKRIEFVLPATTNMTQHTVFREWLQICDKIAEEQKNLLTVTQVRGLLRAAYGLNMARMSNDEIDTFIQATKGKNAPL